MATLSMYQVDAFADSVFCGNPAAVCILDEWLDDRVMQNIASENNLSETAFATLSSGEIAQYDLRWFTPTQEVDLCGHATLATASILLDQRDPGRSKVTFATRSGVLTVWRSEDGYEMELPAQPPVEVNMPDGIHACLGVEPVEFLRASIDNGMNMAVLNSAAQVRTVEPDFDYIKVMQGDGLIVTAPGDDIDPVDFVSRYFAPQAGIPEDPVTGSAHCVLVPYWVERLGRASLAARQVSQRGGSLTCRLEGDRVALGGNAVLYLEGAISI